MKNLVISALLAWFGVAVYADQVNDLCKELGEIGAASMTGRQSNMPMSTMMDLIEGQKMGKFVHDMARKIVFAAYEGPAYQTPDNQKRSVDQHRNYAEMLCYKSPEIQAELAKTPDPKP